LHQLKLKVEVEAFVQQAGFELRNTLSIW